MTGFEASVWFNVIAGLVPAIHSTANAGVFGAMDRGNKCRDDNEKCLTARAL